jgi:hypothetical protein
LRMTAAVAMLSLMALPVMAELTDYQKGVYDGLKTGGQISYLLGSAPYDTTAAQQYNSMVNQFNAWLQAVFGNNQTAINTFLMQPLSGQAGLAYQYPATAYNTKPIHAIDSSFNQTNHTVVAPQGQTVYGVPIEHYCTDNPDSPACNNIPEAFRDSPLGYV